MADVNPASSMPCTASPPIQEAISSQPRPIAASACKNSFTKAWPRSPKKTRGSCGRNQLSKLAKRANSIMEGVVKKIMLTLLVVGFVFALVIPKTFRAQTSPASHLPRGTATDINNSEIDALVRKVAAVRVSDQAIRVVGISSEYNVGTLNDPKEVPSSDEVVTVLNGPSTGGSGIQNGVSRKIGPGDVVIIPPNTPHWFSEIPTDQIVYLVVRIDPHKILPAGYTAK